MLVQIAAIVMLVSGTFVAYGAAMEFRYFGPGTPQFLAGLAATPAGVAGSFGGAVLWRGRRRTAAVTACAILLLVGTAVATALDVMGPFATLLGAFGGSIPLLLTRRSLAATGK